MKYNLTRGALVIAMTIGPGAEALAQAQPQPEPARPAPRPRDPPPTPPPVVRPGRPEPLPGAPPIPPTATPRPGTLPPGRPTPQPVEPKKEGEPTPPGDDAEVLKTKGQKPGVIDTEGDKGIKFDPTATETDGGEAKDEATEVEDVIEWKTNFEKGVKCQKIPLNSKIRLDFNEISLDDLTKFISCITEQNFILAGGAKKGLSVSILSPKPVTVYEAYKAYLSTLDANGLTIVARGKFLEIVASAEAKSSGAPIYGPGKTGSADDRIITRLVQLENVQADEILPVLDKFKTKSADITVYGPTNTMIITDTGSNIRRLLNLVKELDVPIGKEKIWMRQIQYAAADEILQILETLFGSKGAAKKGGAAGSPARATPPARPQTPTKPGQPPTPPAAAAASSVIGGEGDDLTDLQITKMLAVERTNELILVCTRSVYLKVHRVIEKLDRPIPGEGQIHIHYLENADAEEVSQALSSLATGAKQQGRGKGKATSAQAGRATGAGAAATAAAGAAGTGTSTGALFEGEIKITAYKPTNSLIIESSLKDYLSLQKVVRLLDVRRKQVYVEAVIMELSQDRSHDFGITGHGGYPIVTEDGELIPIFWGAGGLGPGAAVEGINSGGAGAGVIGPELDVQLPGTDSKAAAAFSLTAFGFALKAKAKDTHVNVLSTPHILTLDNEEAEIQIGRRQPYETSALGGLGGLTSLLGAGGLGGAASAAGGLASAIPGLGGLGGIGSLLGGGGLGGTNVQFTDTQMSLKITPQVNSSDFVRLEIDQQIEDIQGFFKASTGDVPITAKRKINNTVVVRDGQPVVIGGLMQDKEEESVAKVPILGDIPLLGQLFRQTRKSFIKSNLILIIIPHVIKDPSDLKRIYEQRQKEYRELADALATRRKELEGTLDYRKKNGLLQEMKATVDRARKDRELREAAILEQSDVDTVGPPDTHDIDYDPLKALPKAAPEDGEKPPTGKGEKPPTGKGGKAPRKPKEPKKAAPAPEEPH
jgi:general secretion pathway protein D